MESMRLSENTQQRYRCHQGLFLDYVASDDVHASTPHLYNRRGEFKLANLRTNDFKEYLSARAIGIVPRASGRRSLKPVGKKSLGLEKSALLELYRTHGLQLPDGFHKEIAEYMRGVSREESNRKAEPGKRELDFRGYKWLCERLLCAGDLHAWCFCTLTWAMMCRADTTSNTSFSHLCWKEDALCISVPKSKTNQAGEQPAVPKHIYANPRDPAICPV
jgi:hypothetical protein